MRLFSKIENSKDITDKEYVDKFYKKPTSGIPKSDLASAVQTSLGKADAAVPNTRKVNNKALSSDITLSASDVGALPDTTVIPTKVSDLTNDSGFTTNTGTVTSVSVKMNGETKGPVTSSGTIDLGTVLTDASKFATSAQGTKADNAMPKKGGTFTGEVKFGSTENFQGYYIKRMLGYLGAGTAYNNLDSSYKDGTWHRMWRLRFPSGSNFWGKIKITLYGGYSSFNASGVMSKSITCNFNTSSIYNNVGCYDGLGVNVEQDFRISEAIWNATANAWEVLIWQKNLSGNNSPVIMLECWTTNNTNYINAFNGIAAQAVELTQSTSYSAQKASSTGGTKTVTWATLPVYENPLGEEIATVAMLEDKQDKITSGNKLAASLVSGLATVATSGSYNDLSNKPTINGVEITGTKTSTDLKLGKVTANGGFQAGQGASATTGGAAGQGASATSGGAVGNSASATDGGAVGGDASATYGGAVGGSASATFGGAVGYFASATHGGAVGQGAKVTTGFAGGFNAKAQYKADGTTEVRGAVAIGADAVAQANNAVQLSTGTNANEGSLQFRDYPLVDVNGKIPADRLPGAGTSLGGVKTGGDVTITDGVITVSDDSHNHVISNIDGLQTALDGKANLNSGNTFTGKQTLNSPASDGYSINAAGYIKGSCLQAPSTGKISSNTGKVCVLDGSGWVYYRTPAEIVSDGGGATTDQIPTVNNGKLTIQKNGTDVATFTANQSTNATANITVPTKVSELTNDSGYTTNKGTVTSVSVKMNGETKGPVTSSGTIDLGTVLTDASKFATAAQGTKADNALSLDGGTIKKSKTIKMDASANSNGANLKWGTVNSKNPYIGYASDQSDGTFVVGSLLGTNYASGLAIGGGSGNLLWKGTKVATTNDIPPKVTESTVSDWGFTKNTGTVTSVSVKMNGATKGTVTSSGTIDLGTVVTDVSGKLDKTTYEWNKEFRAGSNGAISLGRYNVYDTQLTFDISSTTTISMNGKLVIATQNGRICQAKVFGDATGVLVSKIVIYQSAIVNNRSWVEVFCNFDGWSKNKVHIYGVALESATVTNQMSSVTFTNGVPSPITSGDSKWSGTIDNDLSGKANLDTENTFTKNQYISQGHYIGDENGFVSIEPKEDGSVALNITDSGYINLDGGGGEKGQVLTSEGAGRTPTWTTPTKGTVTQVKVNGTTHNPNSAGLVDLGSVGGITNSPRNFSGGDTYELLSATQNAIYSFVGEMETGTKTVNLLIGDHPIRFQGNSTGYVHIYIYAMQSMCSNNSTYVRYLYVKSNDAGIDETYVTNYLNGSALELSFDLNSSYSFTGREIIIG